MDFQCAQYEISFITIESTHTDFTWKFRHAHLITKCTDHPSRNQLLFQWYLSAVNIHECNVCTVMSQCYMVYQSWLYNAMKERNWCDNIWNVWFIDAVYHWVKMWCVSNALDGLSAPSMCSMCALCCCRGYLITQLMYKWWSFSEPSTIIWNKCALNIFRWMSKGSSNYLP